MAESIKKYNWEVLLNQVLSLDFDSRKQLIIELTESLSKKGDNQVESQDKGNWEKFVGKVHVEEDPLEFQKRIRNDWERDTHHMINN